MLESSGEGAGPSPAETGADTSGQGNVATATENESTHTNAEAGDAGHQSGDSSTRSEDPTHTSPESINPTAPDADPLEEQQTNEPSNERAHEVARGIFGKKVEDTKAALKREGRSSNTDEKALLRADYYRRGYSDETFAAQGGSISVDSVSIVDSDSGEEVKVIALTGVSERNSDGSITYSAKVTKPDGTSQEISDLSGDVLADAHMIQQHEAIANNFKDKKSDGTMTDTRTSKLMDWHAKGGEDELPVEESDLQAMDDELKEAEKTPSEKVEDALTNEALAALNGREAALKAALSEDPTDTATQEQFGKVKQMKAVVESAMALDQNSIAGILGREAAVKRLQDMGESVGLSQTMKGLDRVSADLKTGAVQARTDLVEAFGSELTEDQIKIIKEKSTTMEGILELINAKEGDKIYDALKGLNTEDFNKAILGQTENMQVDDYLNSLEASLPEEQKAKYRALKASGVAVGVLMLLVLGLVGGTIALAGSKAKNM